ncbi:MAG: peptide chain release factor 1 [Planctomycetota bacterium]|jgi:peptide chain release factor 1
MTDHEQGFLTAPIEGKLLENLAAKESRFVKLEELLGDPDTQGDGARFQEILKEHGRALSLVSLFRDYRKQRGDLDEALELAEGGDDPELKELALAEVEPLEAACREAARAIRVALLDQQAGDADDAILEIRAGAGGDEAALFVADLFKMYSFYCEKHRYKVEVLEEASTDLGGYKEIIFGVKGKGAFGRLCFESGGHRVQRVPATETQGRIHTSAVTVAVMPEAEEGEIEIADKDLRIDTFCASGPGGQKVNKTASAVRITHLPTGTVVSIQDEKSQHKNKAKALRVLRSRIKEAQDRERHEKEASLRRSLIGTGDRSDRIRTYNYPQNRITDHRINLSVHGLERFMAGELDEMIDQLVAHDREERVQHL